MLVLCTGRGSPAGTRAAGATQARIRRRKREEWKNG